MNQSNSTAILVTALAAMSLSSQALAIKMPHKYDPGKTCYKAKFLGKTVGEGCYRVYEDVHSNHRNHFTINTDISAEGSVFNSGRRRVEFIANGWEKGPTGRATRAWFKVNGKTIANVYQRKYGNDSAQSKYATELITNIGDGSISVSVGPVSATVDGKVEAHIKPGMYVAAKNPDPSDTTNGWVRVIHRDSVKLTGSVSTGGSILGFGLGASGALNLINLNTGLVSPKDTKLLLKRTSNGNHYLNRTYLTVCTLGGKVSVWAKAFWKKYSKTLINRKGACWTRQPVNINEMIEYPDPFSLVFTSINTINKP